MIFGLKTIKKRIKKEELLLFTNLKRLKKIHQMFVSLVIFIGIILVWRGVYNIMNQYWFPDNPAFSNISGIIVGLMILVGTHYASSKLV
jgi:intein/homing endonuclease